MKNNDEIPLISKKYSIPSSLYGTAFKVFQKKYVYPRNWIMTVLFLGIAGYYFFCLASDMENIMYWLFAAVCLALTASLWYNPYKLRKNLVKSVENIVDDVYMLDIYETFMTVGMVQEQDTVTDAADDDDDFFASDKQKIQTTGIPLDSSIRIIEKPDFFIVYIVKSVFYIIPKNAFLPDEILKMQKHFEDKLGKNFFKQK